MGAVPMQGCVGTQGTVYNLGWGQKRRSSDIDSMSTGAAPEQERNKAGPGKTGVEAVPVESDCVGVWDAHCMSPGSVTNAYGALYRALCKGSSQ